MKIRLGRSSCVAVVSWSLIAAGCGGRREAMSRADAPRMASLPAASVMPGREVSTLLDNHETVVDTSASPDGWKVRRRGLSYVIEAAGRFAFTLPTSQAQPGGWSVAEACANRVRFTSNAPPGAMTIYADGRMYWGGAFRPAAGLMAAGLQDADALAAQHASPAEVTLRESAGRVNRSTAGDADNDGYNESRGAYQVVASGSRLELTITPRTPVLVRPVIEIAGLPPGELRVTMEGRLVSGAVQLNGGEVLVELPGRLNRPTLVNVAVR
ncbi:MAG: hypothetical protein ABIP55_01035 [Tepidisphaeraceae bacterium]